MKKILSFIFLIGFAYNSFAGIVEVIISDTSLSSVYYHQTSYNEPTKLVFPNLKHVNGYIYFHKNVNLVSIEFPELTDIGSYFYLNGNLLLDSISAPKLTKVGNYVSVSGNVSLKQIEICNLSEITQTDINQIPYYSFQGNNTVIDLIQPCWKRSVIKSISISDSSINENMTIGTKIGTLSALTTLSTDVLKFYLKNDFQTDNSKFSISGNELFSTQTFDYQTDSLYNIKVGVMNQLGEKFERQISIKIRKVLNNDTVEIQIPDTTLSTVYYHQTSFTQPTKLIFPNLKQVNGYIYFHQDVNLCSVSFPNLKKVNGYIYFHQNLSLYSVSFPLLDTAKGDFYFYGNTFLKSISSPKLTTVDNYIYVAGNKALRTLDICNLKSIIQTDNMQKPYYSIQGNNALIDSLMPCWGRSKINSISVSDSIIYENKVQGTEIAVLSAVTSKSTDVLHYYFSNDLNLDNSKFSITGNTLYSAQSFDYEADSTYTIKIGVMNQFGDKLEKTFNIHILNVKMEDTVVIQILDTTLTSIYYHQTSFAQPTKLVFPNLKKVNGYVYFHQDVNLCSVSFPKLKYVDGYFYVYGNNSLDTISSPILDSLKHYLYIDGNRNLQKLDICNLKKIISTDTIMKAYYYINNNPKLDIATTCFTKTAVNFDMKDTIQKDTSGLLLVGIITANVSDIQSMIFYFSDELGNQITNENLLIIGNKVYLSTTYKGKSDTLISVLIGAYRSSLSSLKSSSNTNNGLNEKILFSMEIKILVKSIVNVIPEIKKEIVLYPNPVSDVLNIYGIDSNTIIDIELIDFKGSILSHSNNGNSINLAKIPAGLYYVIIQTQLEKYCKKVVIQ